MAYDNRRQKLIANILQGMPKGEAARAAGYSESFATVNIYRLMKDAGFLAELERARSTSQTTSAMASQRPGYRPLVPYSPQREAGMLAPAELLEPLTPKEELFLNYYLGESRFNATKAAEMAGYEGDKNVLAVTGSNLLRKPKIQAIVRERLDAVKMSQGEVLHRLTEHARGSISDVLDDNGKFDLQTARERGTDGLVKKLKTRETFRKDGSVTVEHNVEMYSSQTALELMGRHHGVLGAETSGDAAFARDVVTRQELVGILQSALNVAIEIDGVQPECIDITPGK